MKKGNKNEIAYSDRERERDLKMVKNICESD